MLILKVADFEWTEAKANGYATGAGDLLDLNTATPTSPAPAPAPVATGSVDLLDMWAFGCLLQHFLLFWYNN